MLKLTFYNPINSTHTYCCRFDLGFINLDLPFAFNNDFRIQIMCWSQISGKQHHLMKLSNEAQPLGLFCRTLERIKSSEGILGWPESVVLKGVGIKNHREFN